MQRFYPTLQSKVSSQRSLHKTPISRKRLEAYNTIETGSDTLTGLARQVQQSTGTGISRNTRSSGQTKMHAMTHSTWNSFKPKGTSQHTFMRCGTSVKNLEKI